MAEWLVELKGHHYDIRTLERFLPDGCALREITDRFWLVLGHADLPDFEAARSEGCRVLSLCNAYARARREDFELVTRGTIRKVGEDGHNLDHLEIGHIANKSRVFPVTLVSVEDAAPPEPETETEWFELAQADSCVEDILKCSVNPERKWYERCWDAYERVRGDLGGTKQGEPTIEAWMGEHPERFAKSVNHHRHAGRDPLPPNPMGEEEALEFVRRLLGKWLDHKLASGK